MKKKYGIWNSEICILLNLNCLFQIVLTIKWRKAKLPITFPHFGSLRYVFEIVLRELGRKDIIIPKKPSKRTFQLGAYYSPEFICTPFKITLGTFIESLEAGANELAMGGTQGTCRFGYYWPVQKLILEDMGYDFKFIAFDYHDPLQIIRVFKSISNKFNYCETLRALRIAWLKNRLTDMTDLAVNTEGAISFWANFQPTTDEIAWAFSDSSSAESEFFFHILMSAGKKRVNIRFQGNHNGSWEVNTPTGGLDGATGWYHFVVQNAVR